MYYVYFEKMQSMVECKSLDEVKDSIYINNIEVPEITEENFKNLICKEVKIFEARKELDDYIDKLAEERAKAEQSDIIDKLKGKINFNFND